MTPHLDFTPLIPVLNAMIQYVLVPGATIAITVVSGFLVQFLVRHGLLKNQQQAEIVRRDISGMADKLVTYDAGKLEAIVPKTLTVPVQDPTVATLANYAIAQVPDLLKKGGMNPATPEGQEALVRLLSARLNAPQPPAPDVTVSLQPAAAPGKA